MPTHTHTPDSASPGYCIACGEAAGAGAHEKTHTPTPWRFVPDDKRYQGAQIWSDGNRTREFWIANVNCRAMDRAHNEANAQFIVTAVNAHDQLIEALEEVDDYLDDRVDVNDGVDGQPVPNTAMRLLQTVRAALAKAKEKK